MSAGALPDRRAEASVAGEGRTPLRQSIFVLESSGDTGYYTLEYEAAFKVPDWEGTARSLSYLRHVAKLHEALLTTQEVSDAM